MSKFKLHHGPSHQTPGPKTVHSLLSEMKDGREFESIIPLVPAQNLDLMKELQQAIAEVEAIRKRPCIAYVGNVVSGDLECAINEKDDEPFAEAVECAASPDKSIDIFLVTKGGSAHQVSRFVNCLRHKFDNVEFLLASYCMSAGTIFALSGDKIWMTNRACLGPIDPQIPSRDGRFVPAQALLTLVDRIHAQGVEALKNRQPIPWSAVRILDNIDKKELADAISATQYSTTMVAQFLQRHKFRDWKIHSSSGKEVTDQEKIAKSVEIASALASHERWKSHGCAIPRNMLLEDAIKLKIDRPEDVPGLERAITRLWALCCYLFDKGPAQKFIVSTNYRFVRSKVN